MIYLLVHPSIFLSACVFLQASIHPSFHRSLDLCFDLLIHVSIPSSLTTFSLSFQFSPHLSTFTSLSFPFSSFTPSPFFLVSFLSIHVTFPYLYFCLCLSSFFCPLQHIFQTCQSFSISLDVYFPFVLKNSFFHLMYLSSSISNFSIPFLAAFLLLRILY